MPKIKMNPKFLSRIKNKLYINQVFELYMESLVVLFFADVTHIFYRVLRG